MNIISVLKEKTFFNQKAATALLFGLLGVLTGTLLFYSLFRRLDIDEFEAIHTAWKLTQGEKIYADFFQHHHPLLYYLLAPLVNFFGESYSTILACRFLIFCALLLCGTMVYAITNLISDKQTALLSVVLLLTTGRFASSAIEIRPDIFQTLFGLCAVYFLLSYLKTKKLRPLLLSAITLSISFLFLQKAVFLAAAIGIVLLIQLFFKNCTFKEIFFYGITFLILPGTYLLYHVMSGSFIRYFLYSFVFNSDYCLTFIPPGSTWACVFLDRISFICKIFSYTFITNFPIWFFFFIAAFTQPLRIFEKILIFFGLITMLSIVFVPCPQPIYLLQGLPFVVIVSSCTFKKYVPAGTLIFVILLTTMAAIPIIGQYLRRPMLSPNYKQWEKINYVLSLTNKDDYVVGFQMFGEVKSAKAHSSDPTTHISWNIFRKDYNFFWFCPTHAIAKIYKIETGNTYFFDAAKAVDTLKPKVIIKNSLAYDAQTTEVNILTWPQIRDHYRQSDVYEEVLIRTA